MCLDAFIVTKFNKICFSWQPEILLLLLLLLLLLFNFKHFVILCPNHKFSYSMTIIISFLRKWIHDSDNSITNTLLCNPLDWLHKLKDVQLAVYTKWWYHTVTLDGYWTQHSAYYKVQQIGNYGDLIWCWWPCKETKQ